MGPAPSIRNSSSSFVAHWSHRPWRSSSSVAWQPTPSLSAQQQGATVQESTTVFGLAFFFSTLLPKYPPRQRCAPRSWPTATTSLRPSVAASNFTGDDARQTEYAGDFSFALWLSLARRLSLSFFAQRRPTGPLRTLKSSTSEVGSGRFVFSFFSIFGEQRPRSMARTRAEWPNEEETTPFQAGVGRV